jgi:carboxyl-terminal processing protease
VINTQEAHADVQVVGSTTVGKKLDSIKLYESDDLQKSGANLNPNHGYAVQLLVFKIKNNVNYPNGIIPEVNFTGIQLEENISDLETLGERSDPLLNSALNFIATGVKTFFKKAKVINAEIIFNSKLKTLAGNNMYLELQWQL